MITTKTIEHGKTRLAEDDVWVKRATYLKDYKLNIEFTDGKKHVVDFGDFLRYKGKGYLNKYKQPENFQRFKVEAGNVVWGKDWDLIFPVKQLYNGRIEII